MSKKIKNIKDSRARQWAIDNTKEEGYYLKETDILELEIEKAFTFAETEQGVHFWRAIASNPKEY